MAENTLLILNRKSAARTDIRPIIRSLQRELGFDVIVPWTGKQMRKTISRHIKRGRARIIAGGGDGTLNSVANSVLRLGTGTDVSLGLVPLGTANDFARGFGDDASDIGRSIQRAVEGEAQPIDVGEINGQAFVNVASGGFGAMITATTPKQVKKRLGGLAYSLTGLARLSELRPNAASVSIDGSGPKDVSILALAVGNSRFAGGGFDVAPDARVDDGYLDLSILTNDIPDFEKLAGGLSRNGPLQVSQFKAARIETDKPFHLNLDGEPMVDTVFKIIVKPAALDMVLPESAG
ncbi:MAG: YegS/Rv2252/BmrU family lipid kinase [Rhizobiaceae bacterium]